MLKREVVESYDDFGDKIEYLKKSGVYNVVMFFVGSKDGDYISWCPDCRVAIPIVEQSVQEFSSLDGAYLYVDVGNRGTWKDSNNPFRLDETVKLNTIPTLMLLNTNNRLEEDDCQKVETVKEFFSKIHNP